MEAKRTNPEVSSVPVGPEHISIVVIHAHFTGLAIGPEASSGLYELIRRVVGELVQRKLRGKM